MCLSIATTATLTSLPYEINLYIIAYGNKATSGAATTTLVYTRMILMLNTCINPIIYGIMWRPFRTSLDKVIILLGHKYLQAQLKYKFSLSQSFVSHQFELVLKRHSHENCTYFFGPISQKLIDKKNIFNSLHHKIIYDKLVI